MTYVMGRVALVGRLGPFSSKKLTVRRGLLKSAKSVIQLIVNVWTFEQRF